MKKVLKKGLAFLLCGVAAASFAACGGGDGDDKTTLLDRAQELSQEVDKIILTKDLLSGAGSVATSARQDGEAVFANASSGMQDVSDPAQNDRYQDYLEWGRLTMDTTKTHLSNADHFVEDVKAAKADVLNWVVQLNTWVTDFSTSEYGSRLNYDAVNDVVIMEKVSRTDNYLYGESFTYYNIKAAQSETGKALIDASFISTHSGELNYRSSVRFFEDELWLYATEILNVQTKNLMRVLVYADLVNGTIASVCDTEIALMKRGEERGYIVKNYMGESVSLFVDNANGERVAKGFYGPNGSARFYVDIYELNGWEALFADGNNVALTLADGKEVTSARVDEQFDDFLLSFYTSENYCPYLELTVDNIAEGKTISACMEESLAYLGLSFKDESVADVIKGYDDLDAFRRSVKVFDEDGMFEPTAEEFETLFERIDIKSPTVDEMRVMAQSEKVTYDKQVEDEAYYELYDTTFSGQASLNQDTGALNLANIAVSSGESVILNEGKYRLCIALCDEFSSVLVSSVEAEYTKGTLSITGAPEYDLNQAPEGEYVLKAYLAKESGARVSRLTKITSAESGEYSLSTEDKELTVTAGVEGITVLHKAIVQAEQ